MPMDESVVLRGRAVSKSFGQLVVLDGIDIAVEKGEVVAIIGPSGSGKSTLLRCFNGLETPTSGTIEVAGQPLSRNRRELAKQREHLGMVFQRFHLFPHLTALQNVMEGPLTVKKMDRRQAMDRAYMLLEKVGLRDKANAYPSKLSGGQQQRVAIARALAMESRDVARRTDVGARSRTGRRGLAGHSRFGQRRHDDASRYTRNGVRPPRG
ncbi:hypothetical protein GCM10025858_19580 [Alicyclobacillus sacchari]|nr:hypothetical protein GCM10025858_19580 [Alicyclobacillus sacchari]